MQILIKISWQNGIEFNIFFTIILRIQRDKLCKVLNAVMISQLVTCKPFSLDPNSFKCPCMVWLLQSLALIF